MKESNLENRPYSQDELKDIRERYIKKMKLSNKYLFYTDTHYMYRCKRFGKKEELIKHNNSNINIGQCSILHKLRETEDGLKPYYNQLINYIMWYDSRYVTIEYLLNEHEFYSWLYGGN